MIQWVFHIKSYLRIIISCSLPPFFKFLCSCTKGEEIHVHSSEKQVCTLSLLHFLWTFYHRQWIIKGFQVLSAQIKKERNFTLSKNGFFAYIYGATLLMGSLEDNDVFFLQLKHLFSCSRSTNQHTKIRLCRRSCQDAP